MTMSKRKAAVAKMKMKIRLAKIKSNDSDGSITSDDIDTLESNILGTVINNDYIIIRYIGRGTFSRVWLAFHMSTAEYRILKIYFPDENDEYNGEKKVLDKVTKSKLSYNLNYYETLSHSIDNQESKILVLPYKGISLGDIKHDIKCNNFRAIL